METEVAPRVREKALRSKWTDTWVYYEGEMLRYQDAYLPPMTHALHYGTGCFEAETLLMTGRKSDGFVIRSARVAGIGRADGRDIHRSATVHHVANAALTRVDTAQLVALVDPFLGVEQTLDEQSFALQFGDPARQPADFVYHAVRHVPGV